MPRKKRASGRKKAPAAQQATTVGKEEESVLEMEASVEGDTTAEAEHSSTASTIGIEGEVKEELSTSEEATQQEEDVAGVKGEVVSEVESSPVAEPKDEPENKSEAEATVMAEPPTSQGVTAPPEPQQPGRAAADERNEFVDSLLTDTSYLIDVSLGYAPEENLKQPLKGFTSEDEVQLFPVIETMSAKLFNIVQKMINCQRKDVEAVMKARKGVLRLPNPLIKAYLCQLSLMEAPSEQEKASPSKRAPHPFLLTEDENVFSEEKLKMLRAVLDAGWKREVVMRSPGSTGRKTGDVYYYSPQGVKFRSSKQVAQHLAELRDTPFTIDNFSFAKVRISTNPDQEIVRRAHDGKSPPRAPPKPSTSKARPPVVKAEPSKAVPRASTSKDSDMETRPVSDEPVKAMSSRRSIQPPKRYSGDAVLLLSKRSKVQDDKHRGSNSNKGLMQMGMLPPKYPKGMEDTSSNLSEGMEYEMAEDVAGSNSVAIKEIAEDSLFQISALRQSGGIDVDSMHHYVASQKQMAQKLNEGEMGAPRPTGSAGKRGDGPVIPCSIRCPGMDGVVPNLQCTRCLCLFHAECLGIPPNLMFSKYVCSNCTEQGTSTSAAATSAGTAFPQKTLIVKKPGEAKRQPPGLAPIPHSGIRRPITGHRDITVTLASKEHNPVRLAQRIIPGHGGPPRGMVRGRGGMMGHVRPASAQIHPGQRVIVSEGSQVPMAGSSPQGMIKRGRGRPPSVPSSRSLPQLNKSVSIQSLPRIQGAPPVPNLQPMGTPKPIPAKIQLPVVGHKPRPGLPAVPNLMKSSAFRLTVPPPNLSGRTFKKMTPAAHPGNLRLASAPAMMMPRGGAQIVQERPNAIKRYPQSICTIGGKKYVVLPKKSRVNTEYVASTVVSAVGNGSVSRSSYTHPESISIKRVEVMPSSAANDRDHQRHDDQRTNCSDGGTSQNQNSSIMREEANNGQSVDDSMEETSTDADAAPMDGVEEGMELNSTNEAVPANQ